MKLETVKSFILTTLVGISLLLTLGLWNFQPDYPFLNDQDEVEMDIGGEEVTQKDIVEPKSIIFHQYKKHFGFADPRQRQNLYHDMQSWVLYNFETKEADGAPTNNYQVEIIFPDTLPMSIVKKIFNPNGDMELPDWSFRRMFITFNSDAKALNIQFLSENERKQAIASVNNAKKYELLLEYATKHDGLREYIVFEDSDLPIYIPKDSIEMTQRSFTVTTTNTNILVNALFAKPSIVSRSNIGEPYYSDSKSGMRVQQDGKLMIFDNPIKSNYERMNQLDLLNRSMSNINDHKGWTGENNLDEGWTTEYNLEEMNVATNRLRYRMFYNGFPIYNNLDLAKIEQEWHNLELYQYQRPLFSLNSSLGGETVELPSGKDLLFSIQNKSNYDVANISDIRVGYHLTTQESTSTKFYIRLEPAWYLKYNGRWQEFDFDEIPLNKGGS